jgi:hypothetical protein
MVAYSFLMLSSSGEAIEEDPSRGSFPPLGGRQAHDSTSDSQAGDDVAAGRPGGVDDRDRPDQDLPSTQKQRQEEKSAVWKRRLIEAFAILTVGDGLIEFLAPKEHSRLWVVGPIAPVADRGDRAEDERPAKLHIPGLAIRGRYLRRRSVTIHWRSTPRDSTARTKSLQICTLRAMRALRSVLCDA